MPLGTECDGESDRCPACGKKLTHCACMRDYRHKKASQRHPIAHATHHELRWRHGHWWARREKIIELMKHTQVNWSKLERFANCGACAHTEWSPSLKKRRIKASYCKDRHCEPCMRAKGNKIAINLEGKLKLRPAGRFRFITLTLRHNENPLRSELERIVKCFRKLRGNAWWKSRVHGGAATIEVKHNETIEQPGRGKWHVHLHLVVDSDWMNKDELSHEWHNITGDSFITDVRKLDDAHDAAFYVAKYISKGTTANVWNDREAAAEWLKATKGMRTCMTFGAWRGMKLTANGEDPGDWQAEDSLDRWIEQATSGDLNANLVLLSLRPPGTKDAIDWQ